MPFSPKRANNINDYSKFFESNTNLDYMAPGEIIDDQLEIKGLDEFENQNMFNDLTKRTIIPTKMDVISMIITYDSQLAVAIEK